MRFEFAPTDGPDVAAAEALQSIAHDVNRIAEALEEDDAEELFDICSENIGGDA